MQLGFIGLGARGNMVHRIHRDSEHQCVAFDYSTSAVGEAESHGATGADSLEDPWRSWTPRSVWIAVPAGDATQSTVDQLAELLEPGDTIIDGGNSRWSDDKAARRSFAPASTTWMWRAAAVWGLQVGYCMMVGGRGGRWSGCARSSTCSPAEHRGAGGWGTRPTGAGTT